MQFFNSLILIILSLGLYFTYIDPTYSVRVVEARKRHAELEEGIRTVERLEERRDELTTAISGLDPGERERLAVILPEGLDSIQLLVDINDVILQQGFFPQGLAITGESVSEHTTSSDVTAGPMGEDVGGPSISEVAAIGKLGNVDFSFSITATYLEFIELLERIEKSLRIVDVISVQVSSGGDESSEEEGIPSDEEGTYTFSVAVRVYGLASE